MFFISIGVNVGVLYLEIFNVGIFKEIKLISLLQ